METKKLIRLLIVSLYPLAGLLIGLSARNIITSIIMFIIGLFFASKHWRYLRTLN